MATTTKNENARWVYNASARRGYVKKIEGFEAWFYTGPSLNFGHIKKIKKTH